MTRQTPTSLRPRCRVAWPGPRALGGPARRCGLVARAHDVSISDNAACGEGVNGGWVIHSGNLSGPSWRGTVQLASRSSYQTQCSSSIHGSVRAAAGRAPVPGPEDGLERAKPNESQEAHGLAENGSPSIIWTCVRGKNFKTRSSCSAEQPRSGRNDAVRKTVVGGIGTHPFDLIRQPVVPPAQRSLEASWSYLHARPYLPGAELATSDVLLEAHTVQRISSARPA